MNNLTTRKIVLGLLMALVLVFSVQGTADAITSFTRGSGDLQLYAPGNDFRISFTPRLQNRVVDIPANSASNIDATYHYDDESININVSGANIRKVGSHDIPPAVLHNMNEQGTDDKRLSGGVTLTLRAAAAGIVTITITDTTSDNNRPNDANDATPLVFTVYITPEHNDTSTITGPTNDVDFSIGEERIDDDFDGLTNNVRVNYTVSGSGSVYVKTANNRGSGSRNLTTSSGAPVYLNMGGGTNKVTASVVGQRADRAETVTYIYGSATLTKESGDEQRGAVSSRLANPLVVKVVDGRGRTVSGVQIDFTTATGGSFLRDPNFPSDLYVTGSNSMVRTNSSGLANVLWVLGNNAQVPQQTATANLTGSDTDNIQANDPEFMATFGTTTSTASSIVIESGDGQRADEFGLLEDPLVVVVRDQRGQRVTNTRVTFLARDGGALDSPSGDDPGSLDANGNDEDTIKDILTDSSGEASVRYTPPDGGGRRTVSASISGGLKSVTFTVNGTPSSGGGGGDDDDDDDTTTPNRLAITPTSISGAPDATRTITVTALNTSSVAVSNVSVTLGGLTSFLADGGTLSSTAGVTPFTSTLTLPDTAATHLITAFATGYTSVSTLVTVTAAAAPGTLSITTVGAAVNGQQTIEVSVRNADGTAPSGAVPVTLTGPGISRTVDTVGGTGRAIITLPTATVSYVLTVSATGYTSGSVTLTPSGQTTTTTTTTTTTRGPVGEADSVEIDGQRQRSGTVNQAMHGSASEFSMRTTTAFQMSQSLSVCLPLDAVPFPVVAGIDVGSQTRRIETATQVLTSRRQMMATSSFGQLLPGCVILSLS